MHLQAIEIQIFKLTCRHIPKKPLPTTIFKMFPFKFDAETAVTLETLNEINDPGNRNYTLPICPIKLLVAVVYTNVVKSKIIQVNFVLLETFFPQMGKSTGFTFINDMSSPDHEKLLYNVLMVILNTLRDVN